jgi:hypothetical protein
MFYCWWCLESSTAHGCSRPLEKQQVKCTGLYHSFIR